MKLLAVGDIHGDVELARRLAKKADKENVDLVVICGDITNSEQSVENIIGQFRQKVVLIPGNHESLATVEFLAELYSAKNLHGTYLKSGNVGLFGCGSANVGLFQLPESEIFNLLKKSHYFVKNCAKKVMVTHVHPKGTVMERLTRFFPGSTGVRKAVDILQPDILLCSHVHEAEGLEENIGNTKIINVGRKGKIIDL